MISSRKVVYPKWLLCVSLHIAKLVSTAPNNKLAKPLSWSCSEMLHVIPKSLVCMRYFTTRLSTSIRLAFCRPRWLESTLRWLHDKVAFTHLKSCFHWHFMCPWILKSESSHHSFNIRCCTTLATSFFTIPYVRDPKESVHLPFSSDRPSSYM